MSVAPRQPPDDENLQRSSGARLALVVVAAVPIEEIRLRENGGMVMCAGWLTTECAATLDALSLFFPDRAKDAAGRSVRVFEELHLAAATGHCGRRIILAMNDDTVGGERNSGMGWESRTGEQGRTTPRALSGDGPRTIM